jgi:sialate O-acetylesterase
MSSLFLLLLIIQCNAVPRFANYFQDHMVLQRAPQRAIVWGYGDPSTLTTLSINDRIYTIVSSFEPANERGESIWSVTLDPVSQEGPFDIHVSQPLANGTLVTITIHDVLFGDVWLCSGQSNMVLPLSWIYNASEEIANAGKYPKIRLFTVESLPSATPLEELLNITQNWSVASPQSVNGSYGRYFSAVCWLYGRMIHQALNERPLGLMVSAFVGTAIEVWMPPIALQDCNATE